MLVLFCTAFLVAFAAYRSAAVGGDEVLNATRLVKAAAWLMAAVWTVDCMLNGRPLHSPMTIVGAMAAFADAVSGMTRFRKLLGQELRQDMRIPTLRR